MKLQPLNSHAASGAAGAAARWASEFAKEKWAINPLDQMTASQFEAMLVTKFGADYLAQVDYERLATGQFVPVQTPAGRIRSLFRRHPEGLTRLQVKLLAGLSNGQVADIVCTPNYQVIGERGEGRHRSQVWAPAPMEQKAR